MVLEVWFKAAGEVSTSFVADKHLQHGQILNPLKCLTADNAINNAAVRLKRAHRLAKQAADPVFLAVPHGMPHEQAVSAANRITFHYESGGRAAGRLLLAIKFVS